MNSSRPYYRTAEDLVHFDQLSTPVWVFDVDRHGIWWGNRSAVSFWKAGSLADLKTRDFSSDSETVRVRLRRIVELTTIRGSIQETWTLYPHETPVTVILDLKPATIDDGRNAIVLEAVQVLDLAENPDALRILEAARSSAILVSTFSKAGELLSQNPASHDCYSGKVVTSGLTDLAQRFTDQAIGPAILAAVQADGRYQAEVQVNTARGQRIHHVIASKGRDPVSGEFVTVLNEEDRTEQALLRQQLQALNDELERRVQDRTQALKEANDNLRIQMQERRQVEEKLRSAQRMEAIGKLTGGIAHDFNNILAVILGNLDFLEVGGHYLDEAREAISRSVARGSELTQRLLAFSRKQPLSPQALEVDALVRAMVDLLTRTIGETIRITIGTAAGQWRVLADPGQLENAILNIALNARDAMPNGGSLSISSANLRVEPIDQGRFENLEPGDYVTITISDTGSGMSPKVSAHAFEPFFTTKEVGKGSGLGLSMVYGFARQSGGTALIESSPRAGTSVRLILPRSVEASQPMMMPPEPEVRRSEGETVLLIEDNRDLLKVAKSMLQNMGYRVLAAVDAEVAQRHLVAAQAADSTVGPIDIVLTDVVLPGGVSGPEFVARAREVEPSLKVVFMSGYPRELLANAGLEESSARLIQKPFTGAKLGQTLRETLDQTN